MCSSDLDVLGGEASIVETEFDGIDRLAPLGVLDAYEALFLGSRHELAVDKEGRRVVVQRGTGNTEYLHRLGIVDACIEMDSGILTRTRRQGASAMHLVTLHRTLYRFAPQSVRTRLKDSMPFGVQRFPLFLPDGQALLLDHLESSKILRRFAWKGIYGYEQIGRAHV